MRPVEWLVTQAKADARWCLVHATHMTEHETAALAASGAVAGLAPTTEADLGDGTFPGIAYLGAGGRFEPIEADEVAAFKQALASAAAARPATVPGAQGTRSGPLLPPSPSGFEDTVMPGQEGHRANLSSTQYGDL